MFGADSLKNTWLFLSPCGAAFRRTARFFCAAGMAAPGQRQALAAVWVAGGGEAHVRAIVPCASSMIDGGASVRIPPIAFIRLIFAQARSDSAFQFDRQQSRSLLTGGLS
jgi:hypothetical protein